LRLEGDFVECACYRGTTARIICDSIDFALRDKQYYLYDKFDQDPRDTTQSSEAFYAQVKDRFSDLVNVRVIAGIIPEVLKRESPEHISFMHLDCNNAEAEVGALEMLFERMSPGAVLILDDYGWHQYREQKINEDAFFAARGYNVLELPTGQGLVIR
jgi:hypothetical protein